MYRDRRIGVVVPGYNEELLPGETPASIPGPVDRISVVNDFSKAQTRQQTILVAMPAYNEERSIAGTVHRIQQYVGRVLVIDDGSKDATGAIATALGARVVRHPKNRGYGGALQTIFQTAREMGVERLVILDADGQHNPADIPALLAVLDDGADVVIGSRFLDDSKGEIPTYRKVGMKVLDGMTHLAGGVHVTDSQSGFRAYGRRAIEMIQISGKGMSAGSEILIQAAAAGLAIAEVPITVRYDLEGTSSEHPVAHGIKVLIDIVRLISCRRPLIFFGIPGLVFAISGFCVELYAFSQFYLTAQFHYLLFSGGVVFLILGFNLGTVGMILYSMVHLLHEHGGGAPARSAYTCEDAEPDQAKPTPEVRR